MKVRVGAPGVVVLGMHRSGTSAAAGLLHLAGLQLPDPRYRLRRGRSNPKGFFEVRPLNRLNEALLRELGGDWTAPPHLQTGWTDDPRARARKAEGLELFAKIMPRVAWLWKDPRLCLTLPLWREVAREKPLVFLVLRNPLEITRSLQERDGFTREHSLALWEAYTASAVASAAGHPVAVVEYESILADPVSWSGAARAWMIEHGVRCAPAAPEAEVRALIDPQLRHASNTLDDFRADTLVSNEQRDLLAGVLASIGYHDSYRPLDLPPRTAWAEELMAERRRDLPPLELASNGGGSRLRFFGRRRQPQGGPAR